MDNVFWWGIILGGSVGFIASVVANLSTPFIGDYFARSKSGWLERGKKRALKEFNSIIKFRNGSEDRYMYFVSQWGFFIFYSVFTACFINEMHDEDSMGVRYIAATFLAALNLAFAAWTYMRLSVWYWRMNNFEEYKSTLLKKWPDLQLG